MSRWRWSLIASAAATISLLASVPADAAYVTPSLSGYPTMNLQAPTVAITVPLHFDGGDPDSWKLSVISYLPSGTGEDYTEHEIARTSGTGPVAKPAAQLLDQNWRWRFLNQADMQVRLIVEWTSGAEHGVWEDVPYLRMMSNQGPYGGGLSLPGRFDIYDGLGSINITPEPYYAAVGELVHDTTKPATFAKGRRQRRTATVPYVVPPLGATHVRANVEYVPRSNPRHSTVVYKGKRTIAAAVAPGARVDVRTKLTPAGRKLAKRLGVNKLAGKLASSGRIWFNNHQPTSANPIQLLAVPMGNCFADDQVEPGYPCKQTCPPFPHMPTGYVVYSQWGEVYGSPTCTRGAPLIPWPAY